MHELYRSSITPFNLLRIKGITVYPGPAEHSKQWGFTPFQSHQLSGMRAAAQALGKSAGRDLGKAKKRVMSAVARARIGRAAKKRWAKFRKEAKRVAA